MQIGVVFGKLDRPINSRILISIGRSCLVMILFVQWILEAAAAAIIPQLVKHCGYHGCRQAEEAVVTRALLWYCIRQPAKATGPDHLIDNLQNICKVTCYKSVVLTTECTVTLVADKLKTMVNSGGSESNCIRGL